LIPIKVIRFFIQFCSLLVLLSTSLADPVQNVSQIITSWGYPEEDHWVETDDGFILGMQRIPHGKNGKSGPRPVVLLQHGLLDSACTWVINLPNESLGFILADAGFDVFLGNARGNTYSSQNAMYTPDQQEYWDLIDFDNMIAHDLPTMINKALEVSGQKSLIYIGHSQGTLMGFGAFPLQPELAAKVTLFIGLAPVAFVGNQESILLSFLAELDFAAWLAFFGEEDFMPSDWLVHILAGSVCKEVPELCADVVFLLCGFDVANMNDTRMPFYIDHTPAGTSVRNMWHWSQLVNSNAFQMWDYGSSQANEQHYNQSTPPLYRPQDLYNPPLAFFTGSKDILADPTDFARLLSLLPTSNSPVVVHNEAAYNHLDFTWAENAHTKIYPDIVQLAQKYSRVK